MEVCTKSHPLKCCDACRKQFYKDRYARRKAAGHTTVAHKGPKARITAETRRNELRKIIYEHYEITIA